MTVLPPPARSVYRGDAELSSIDATCRVDIVWSSTCEPCETSNFWWQTIRKGISMLPTAALSHVGRRVGRTLRERKNMLACMQEQCTGDPGAVSRGTSVNGNTRAQRTCRGLLVLTSQRLLSSPHLPSSRTNQVADILNTSVRPATDRCPPHFLWKRSVTFCFDSRPSTHE